MKRLAQLVLAFSITVLSASALALESLEDEVLAATTGQDGVTISVTPPAGGIPFSTVIHDTDPAIDGAIVIGRPLAAGDHIASSINTGGLPINILLDATGDIDSVTAGNQASLGINISIPAGTVINTGTLSVAQSNGGGVAVSNQSNVIMNNLAITLGATNLNLTLGNEVATTGQMMRLTTTMASGLLLNNVAIRDANAVDANGVAIRASSIQIDNAGASTALDVDVQVDVISTGLQAKLVTFGTGGADITISDMRLGNTASTSMGTLNISGLNVNGGVLKIYGH